MFRASSVPIIRGYPLYTWQLVRFMQAMWPLPSRVRLELPFHPDSARKRSHNLHKAYQLPCIQWIAPDDGHRRRLKHVGFYDKNKYWILMHLVGYFYEKNVCHDTLCSEEILSRWSVWSISCWAVYSRLYFDCNCNVILFNYVIEMRSGTNSGNVKYYMYQKQSELIVQIPHAFLPQSKLPIKWNSGKIYIFLLYSKSYPITGLDRLLELQEVEATRISRQSAL